jgi:hypothetical protein
MINLYNSTKIHAKSSIIHKNFIGNERRMGYEVRDE